MNKVCNDIVKQIGFTCNRPMDVSPAGRLVPKRQKFWTSRELAKLRECYATASRDELLRDFAPRSMRSIVGAANNLGLRRKRNWQVISENHVPAFTFS